MNFRILPVVHLLITLSTLAIALPAQEEEQEVRNKLEALRREREEGGSDDDRAKIEAREKEEWENLTPEQRLERRTRRGASAHCQFVASCRPAKLMPGQSGIMVVAALLKGNAVIPSPAPVELLRTLTEAPVDLGQLMVRPASMGTDAAAYVGKPVYENYAWFEIPVTMRPDAKTGDKHRVAVDLKFDLYDGGSAMPVGRFLEQVAVEVEVGLSLDPNVAGHGGAVANPGVKPVEAVPAAKVAEPPAPEASGDALAAEDAPVRPQAPVPAPVEVEEGNSPGASAAGGEVLPSSGDDGLPVPLLVGGGVFALLLILLLGMRRK